MVNSRVMKVLVNILMDLFVYSVNQISIIMNIHDVIWGIRVNELHITPDFTTKEQTGTSNFPFILLYVIKYRYLSFWLGYQGNRAHNIPHRNHVARGHNYLKYDMNWTKAIIWVSFCFKKCIGCLCSKSLRYGHGLMALATTLLWAVGWDRLLSWYQIS